MNLLDTRPPFAGINGEISPEFKTLTTPCYLIDEAVLQHNAEVLGALQSARAARCFWHRRRSAIMIFIRFSRRIWPVRKRAACLKRGSALKKCRAARCMCFAPPTVRTKWTSCCAMRITLCSIRRDSCKSSRPKQKLRAKASVCASTRSALRRRDTKFTIPVRPQPPRHHPCAVG